MKPQRVVNFMKRQIPMLGLAFGLITHITAIASQPVTAARSQGATHQAKPAEPVGNPVRLYEAFLAEKAMLAKSEVCIRDKKCPSDEGEFFRRAETAYQIQKQIEALAKRGNLDGAYLAGLIAYEQAKRFDEDFRTYASFGDAEYRKSGMKFADLAARELRRAREFLLPAAKAMKPEACFLMGEVLEFERFGAQGSGAAPYYYCATREWFMAGQRELAFRAYAGLLRSAPPQDPMLVEMHAKLQDKQPTNPWRPLQPLSSSSTNASSSAR